MRTRRIDPNRYVDPGVIGGIVQQVRLTWRLLHDPRVPATLKTVVPMLAVLYAVLPIDVVPDLFLGLGQLDDLGVVLAALALFVRLAPKAVVAEHLATISGRRRAAGGAASEPETVIDADYTVHERRRGAAGR